MSRGLRISHPGEQGAALRWVVLREEPLRGELPALDACDADRVRLVVARALFGDDADRQRVAIEAQDVRGDAVLRGEALGDRVGLFGRGRGVDDDRALGLGLRDQRIVVDGAGLGNGPHRAKHGQREREREGGASHPRSFHAPRGWA